MPRRRVLRVRYPAQRDVATCRGHFHAYPEKFSGLVHKARAQEHTGYLQCEKVAYAAVAGCVKRAATMKPGGGSVLDGVEGVRSTFKGHFSSPRAEALLPETDG